MIPLKIPVEILEIGKTTLKFMKKESSWDREHKAILNRKSKAEGIAIPDLKIYHRATVTQSVRC